VARNDLAFARLAAPDGPFDPLQLALTVNDPLDGVPLLALNVDPTTSGDCLAAGNCTARVLGAPTRLVYGRLVVLPASGPENEHLGLPLAAQMFTGDAFEQNPADSCSSYDAVSLSLGGYAGNLEAGETTVIGPAGLATFTGGAVDPGNPPSLAAPGFGNDGSVLVTLDVGPWLEFDWHGSGLADPAATASFGRFRGHDRIIYWGEPR
jgi:MSHA biogenesis protein MshQ